MAILPILTAPDKRLKMKAVPVDVVDDEIRRLMDDMLETMYDASGIGLAAPQVGVSKRIIVLDVAYAREPHEKIPIFLVNPEIVQREGEQKGEEGCLSVPEYTADVPRDEYIRVRGLGRDGEPLELEAEGLLSVCFQHEIDHLNGTLFIDHLSRLKRAMVLKKLRKAKEEEAA
ncbi:MAG: peptide deformylase [Magnetococcales bacterium]|nr:peptide deformylase [Magnetococcales bacterium]